MELIKTINVTLLECICSACASNLERCIREEQKCLRLEAVGAAGWRAAHGTGVQMIWHNFKVNGDDKEANSENLSLVNYSLHHGRN